MFFVFSLVSQFPVVRIIICEKNWQMEIEAGVLGSDGHRHFDPFAKPLDHFFVAQI